MSGDMDLAAELNAALAEVAALRASNAEMLAALELILRRAAGSDGSDDNDDDEQRRYDLSQIEEIATAAISRAEASQ